MIDELKEIKGKLDSIAETMTLNECDIRKELFTLVLEDLTLLLNTVEEYTTLSIISNNEKPQRLVSM